MKIKVNYKKAWGRLRRVLKTDDLRLSFSSTSTGINYVNKNLILQRMDKIRKQCTKKERGK